VVRQRACLERRAIRLAGCGQNRSSNDVYKHSVPSCYNENTRYQRCLSGSLLDLTDAYLEVARVEYDKPTGERSWSRRHVSESARSEHAGSS